MELDVALMLERVAYHREDYKSDVVNYLLRAALEQLPEAKIKSKWE